ncbi:hypothetical protein [Paenibacillus puerhi]|uniref:hypothetical protein n=1 Tax=Paenibacillus puerhi TaxID=2692622 RepID=UPI00135B4A26|nr:hypothetical protein [Paenibacillus puerhi]
MSREHIIHFKVIRQQEAKVLRGLIYLEDGQQPTLHDFERCLKECGHDIQGVENYEQFIFRAKDQSGGEYLIDVLEDYERLRHRDRHAEMLARSFIKQDPLL